MRDANLFQNKHGVIELLLQSLIRQVDAHLLKAVDREHLHYARKNTCSFIKKT